MKTIKKKIKTNLKKKYWYRIEIYACVLCGHENKHRYRVYNEKEKGLYWYDDACRNHFI